MRSWQVASARYENIAIQILYFNVNIQAPVGDINNQTFNIHHTISFMMLAKQKFRKIYYPLTLVRACFIYRRLYIPPFFRIKIVVNNIFIEIKLSRLVSDLSHLSIRADIISSRTKRKVKTLSNENDWWTPKGIDSNIQTFHVLDSSTPLKMLDENFGLNVITSQFHLKYSVALEFVYASLRICYTK